MAAAPPMPPRRAALPRRYRLAEDAVSAFKRSHVYGRKGDIVTEVSQSDPAVIVEAADGNRFPIHKSKLIQITS